MISEATGLHARVNVVPPVVITGGVLSLVQVTVRETVEVLPQPSIAVQILVCERLQLLLVTVPSFEVTVGVPHASVAVAVPSAALISVAAGLHPRVVAVPPVVMVGGVTSDIHVTVREAVDVLPQSSLAVHVLVCERLQPLLLTAPSFEVSVGMPHASVAVAVPSAPVISDAPGLHPNVVVVPPVVITGGVISNLLIVAGDSMHPISVPGVPAGVKPHAALVTYRVLIL